MTTYSFLKSELRAIDKKLKALKKEKNQLNKELKELEKIIDNIEKKYRETEAGLNETVNNVKNKLSKIPRKTKLGNTYLDKIKKTLFNEKSNEALYEISEAKKKAKKKYYDKDDRLDEVKFEINKLEDERKSIVAQMEEISSSVESSSSEESGSVGGHRF